jgi:hypothetical protein
MANSKLLKEAIADAKAVRETAIANAKIALEEAFTPRLQSILSKKLQSEMEGEEEEADVNEEYGAEDTSDADSSAIGDGENKQPADDANDSSDIAQGNPDTDVETAQTGEEDENIEVVAEAEEDELPGEDQSRIEEEDEDELDLESIIRELEDELGGEELSEEEPSEEEPVYEEEAEEEEASEEPAVEEAEGEDEEIDLDEILREMGYGDDEEAVEEGEDEDAAEAMAAKDAELEEAYNVIKSLKSTINEVNLLNAKLLYTNKLFRSYDLTNEQKHKVVETLDRTQNVREVKLVFSTLAESMKIGGTAKKVKAQTKLTESFASKQVASTAPKKEIIAESNQLADRFKQLANIK